jgi:hypothetical protein
MTPVINNQVKTEVSNLDNLQAALHR